jgi:uncharacterized protein YoaH (UPF0181 family)
MANYRDLEIFNQGFQQFGQNIGAGLSKYFAQRKQREEDERKWNAIRAYAAGAQDRLSGQAQRFGSVAPVVPQIDMLKDVRGMDPGQVMQFIDQFERSQGPNWESVNLPTGERVREGTMQNRAITEPILGPDDRPIKREPKENTTEFDVQLVRQRAAAQGISTGEAWDQIVQERLRAGAQTRGEVGQTFAERGERRRTAAEIEETAKKVRRAISRNTELANNRRQRAQELKQQLTFTTRDGRTMLDTGDKAYPVYEKLLQELQELEADIKADAQYLQELSPKK